MGLEQRVKNDWGGRKIAMLGAAYDEIPVVTRRLSLWRGLPFAAADPPDGRGCGTREAVPVDAIENPSPGEGMRESACIEFVKAEENDGWIPIRDDCPRTTGKHEAWREDERVGCLEGGGAGVRAP